ncbi:MAG TPA: hypothetical protein VGL88_08305 [Pseudonocardiaceae bacterium]
MENSIGTTVRSLNVFDGLALLIALALVGAGFFIGIIGLSQPAGTTTSAELSVTPDNDLRNLTPGTTKTFPLYVRNPADYGVQVTAIDAGQSKAVGACPAGAVTTAPVQSPPGFIQPGSIRAYEISVTMAANAASQCTGKSFTLPLNVTLGSAAAGRSFSFGNF